MFSEAEHTDALAAYLPNGHAFEAKNVNDSNLRALLRGLASELFTAQNYLTEFEQEYFPDTTVLFLSEWESALALPDSCLSVDGTNEERLLNIIVKLANMNLQVPQDFVDLAALFGVVITATPGADTTGFITYDSITTARFTIVIEFPLSDAPHFTYNFPIIFGDATESIIKCLFQRLKPGNAVLLFA